MINTDVRVWLMFAFWIIKLKLSYCSDSTLTQNIQIIFN